VRGLNAEQLDKVKKREIADNEMQKISTIEESEDDDEVCVCDQVIIKEAGDEQSGKFVFFWENPNDFLYAVNFQRSTTSVVECPDYIKCIQGTNFIVDAFPEENKGMQVFLTHFHKKQYHGLNNSFKGNIYCTLITSTFLKQEFHLRDSQITSLPLNETIVVDGVKVTALDANQ
jgi:hypothetical protein